MKLLFDQNLAHRLVDRIADAHPGSAHTRSIGLARADDTAIWAHAVEHGYTIVTKDSDFAERALLEGPPPKVLWIQLGNCTTQEIEALLRERRRSSSPSRRTSPQRC